MRGRQKKIGFNIFLVTVFAIIVATFIFFTVTFFKIGIKETFKQKNRVVCMYAYYEKNEKYKDNLSYFLRNGIREDVDYYFVINGDCTVPIPENLHNVNVLQRGNTGYDFGAWQAAIHEYGIGKSLPYDTYFFMNSSVKGPFPEYSDWVETFLQLFQTKKTNIPPTKLVGTTINILQESWTTHPLPFKPPYIHVQSMFFCLDDEGFQYLLQKGFFDDDEWLNTATDMKDIVTKKEITMSQLILERGWNINCMLPTYRDKDYSRIKANFNPSGENPWPICGEEDVGRNFGKHIKPEEVIFYKNNISCIT